MGWTYIPGVPEEELYHHGILGQKWGRRRYQNPDGSYTQAGRARYGIFGGRKRKMSRDAKLRAEERVRVKNEEARREAYTAEAERARAQADAERAKTELREAKKQNSLAYKLGSKAAENAAYKAEQKRMAKEANKPLSKNASKYIEAIQSGNKRKIEKVARQLNNDEYRAAINRINMTYEMDRLKTEASIAKGKQTVQRLTNAANMLTTGVDVWNAGAGIISAFSGKNVPKINTKYQDPLDRISKELKNQQTELLNRQNKAKAEAEEYATGEARLKYEKAKGEYDRAEATRLEAETNERQKARAEEILSRLSSPKPGMSRSFSERAKDTSVSDAISKGLSPVTVTKKNPSFKLNVPDDRTFEPIDTRTISVSKKKQAKELVNGYRKDIGQTSIEKYISAFVHDGEFDIEKLPKEEQQTFFAMLNSKM